MTSTPTPPAAPSDEAAIKPTYIGARERNPFCGDMVLLTPEQYAALLAANARLKADALFRDSAYRELLKALGDLSFECDGVTSTSAPTLETYNRTFAIWQHHRHVLITLDAALSPHNEAGK